MELAAVLVLATAGCSRSPGSTSPQPARQQPAAAISDSPVPRIRRDCLEAYATCPMIEGLPALSADGELVAVPDMERAGEREERVLTVRIFDVDSGRALSELPVITYRDYDEGADPMTAELHPATQAAVEQRVVAVERELARGRYRPLTALGTVHEQRAGQDIDGLRASFDGQDLTVVDTRTGQVRWQRAIGPEAADAPVASDIECEPAPVAEVGVWVDRASGVIVAHASYMGTDACDRPSAFLVWRFHPRSSPLPCARPPCPLRSSCCCSQPRPSRPPNPTRPRRTWR
jgi:hypothetical protein